MNSLIQHPITEALGWTMIHSLWQLTLLAILHRGLLALPALQKAQIRYIAGMALLGLALLLPALTFLQVYEPPLVQELAQHTADLAIPLEATDEASAELLLKTPPPSETGQAATSFYERLQHLLIGLEPLISPLALGWILGILFMGIRFGGSWFYLRSLRREGLEAVEPKWESTFQQWVAKMGIWRPVRVYYSQKVFEPITLGHLKPLVLIPLGLLSQQDPQQIEALILHELAHIRRHDFTFNIVQSWVEILFFYHPAIWWISRDVRESREHCCDDTAIAVSQNPLAYAQALTQLQLTHIKHPQKQLTMSASGNTSKFTQRIYRIMGQPTRRLEYSRGNVVAILAFLATFLFAFQQQQFQEEQKMLEELMKNPAVDTNTLQNWMLFTIHPSTQQKKLDAWVTEVAQLSTHPLKIKFKADSKSIRELTSIKNENGEEKEGWRIYFAPKFEGLEKVMLVYDPILDRMYIHLNQSGYLHFYDLATHDFGVLGGDSLPFGKAVDNESPLPTISFQEQAIDQLPADEFPILFTPQTTMDELLGWSSACAKLGMKLEYDQIGFDSETGDLVKISGVYQNSVGKTLPFDYQDFSLVQFKVDRNKQTIPVAFVAKVDSSGASSFSEFGEGATPIATYRVHAGSSEQELEQIRLALEQRGIQLEWDHISKNLEGQIDEIFGRFLYPNKTFRLFKIEQLNELDIQVFAKKEDPIQLILGKGTLGSQIHSPKALFTPVVEGNTHRFGRHLNIKKGPGTFEESGIYNMWYGSSEAIFQSNYKAFEKNLSGSSLLYLNNRQINSEEFRQLALPVDSVKEFFYRDPIAAKLELGKDFFGPVYHVNTFNQKKRGPFSKISGTTPISLDASTDSPLAPILVLDGKILPRTGPAGTLTPGSFKEQLGIDSDDIERINVLKGKAAFEKYGEIAANGVIEIELKSTLDTTLSPILVINGKVSPRPAPSGNFTPEVFKEQIGIDSEDIESINVLKGKAALEKYGEKATNGVIEIKTKSIPDTSKRPILVINGTVSSKPAPSGNFTPEVFKKQMGIDPEDIKTINVIKGEAAIKKYGSKGINGVVEIITKDTPGLEGPKEKIEDIEPGSLPEIDKGEPNSQVIIKGSASKDSNQPLFVIDGIELDHYSIGDDGFLDIDLNPADIEHINVLKGEAAKVKYGPKGEKGVIEIETKLPEIIRLKISDFVLPNGNASATLKHSQKYDDVLILRDWKESALSINGSLPEDRIDDLPFKKKQDYNALSQHHIHSIHSYKMNQRSGDKWVRFIYTDKAPEVLWRPSATGDYRDIDSKTQLFFLNMPKYRGQKMPLILVPYMAGLNRKNYYIQIHGADGEIMAQAYPDYSNWNLDSVEIDMRILNRKESIAEFGTSGVTGLLVVSFDQTEEKMDTSLDGKIKSPQTHPELYPFKSAGTQFPVSGIGVAPNPAQEGEVDIRLILEKKQEVRISIFDRLGKEVAFVQQKTFEKGGHTIPWSLDRLPAGYYLVVAQVDGKGMSTPLIIK